MKKINQKIYGLNKDRTKILTKKLGFNIRIKDQFLPNGKFFVLRRDLAHKKKLKSLYLFNFKKIKFLKDNKSYRGLRHRRFLPVRGQRTRTNARNCKKKRH